MTGTLPEITRDWLGWAELLSPAFFLAAVALPVGFQARRARWGFRGFWLLLAQIAAGGLHLPTLAGVAGLLIEAGAAVLLVRNFRESMRLRTAWQRRWAEEAPIRLAAPFEGRWKALGTGPSAARNHHLAAVDQWFAVDWIRLDAPSRGSTVLAPVDGTVAYVEDGYPDKPASRRLLRDVAAPAGNYVSLRLAERPDACVILAHLERDSILVRPGEWVSAGQPLARCGNSGNTTIPHLHLHAQTAERVSPGAVRGVPVVSGEQGSWTTCGEQLEGDGGAAIHRV